ncbi:hypothetical protein JZ751_007589 [Albula glossodonta]|uniref:Uncharacterized protein n=1 Tax=Albula glossodonta TaxID=121402 RepID=A0A8T2N3L4_9TELE|nr:hypothetical protein JZ751_007589 [Albula glossodonta]
MIGTWLRIVVWEGGGACIKTPPYPALHPPLYSGLLWNLNAVNTPQRLHSVHCHTDTEQQPKLHRAVLWSCGWQGQGRGVTAASPPLTAYSGPPILTHDPPGQAHALLLYLTPISPTAAPAHCFTLHCRLLRSHSTPCEGGRGAERGGGRGRERERVRAVREGQRERDRGSGGWLTPFGIQQVELRFGTVGTAWGTAYP